MVQIFEGVEIIVELNVSTEMLSEPAPDIAVLTIKAAELRAAPQREETV